SSWAIREAAPCRRSRYVMPSAGSRRAKSSRMRSAKVWIFRSGSCMSWLATNAKLWSSRLRSSRLRLASTRASVRSPHLGLEFLVQRTKPGLTFPERVFRLLLLGDVPEDRKGVWLSGDFHGLGGDDPTDDLATHGDQVHLIIPDPAVLL